MLGSVCVALGLLHRLVMWDGRDSARGRDRACAVANLAK